MSLKYYTIIRAKSQVKTGLYDKKLLIKKSHRKTKQKNAVRRKNKNCLRLPGEQPDDMRKKVISRDSGAITKPASRLPGEQPGERCKKSHKPRQRRYHKTYLTHVGRTARRYAPQPATSFRQPGRRNRRDDRAMMTKKERGDVNSRSRASPLF